jgi:hypothetical protein
MCCDWSWQDSQVALVLAPARKCDERTAPPSSVVTFVWHAVHSSGPAFHATSCGSAPSGLWQATEQIVVPPAMDIVPFAVPAPPGNVTLPKLSAPGHAWQTAQPNPAAACRSCASVATQTFAVSPVERPAIEVVAALAPAAVPSPEVERS